jgi:hypothetical protein
MVIAKAKRLCTTCFSDEPHNWHVWEYDQSGRVIKAIPASVGISGMTAKEAIANEVPFRYA